MPHVIRCLLRESPQGVGGLHLASSAHHVQAMEQSGVLARAMQVVDEACAVDFCCKGSALHAQCLALNPHARSSVKDQKSARIMG